jgi:hypothetical protein
MSDLITDPELGQPKRIMINNLAYSVMKDTSPDDFAKFLAKHTDSNDVKKFKNDLLMEMKRNPQTYKDHLEKALEFNHSLPRENRFLNPFWESHIFDLLGKK